MSYQSLFDEILVVVESYSLSTLLNGLDASLVNILLTRHMAKIELCLDYSTSIQMVNHALSAHVGINIQVDTFITDEKDRRKLYDLFQEWRQRLLAEIGGQKLYSQIEEESCI